MKDCHVVHMPNDYKSWTELLKTFETVLPDEETIKLLSCGTCPEYSGIKVYLHARIEETVNKVIANCIKELKRNIIRFSEMQEIEGYHVIFMRFAKRIDACMFFVHIDFLEIGFKMEMYNEVCKEVYRFWNDLTDSVKKTVISNNNVKLDEELYMIKRIRLFKKYQDFLQTV